MQASPVPCKLQQQGVLPAASVGNGLFACKSEKAGTMGAAVLLPLPAYKQFGW